MIRQLLILKSVSHCLFYKSCVYALRKQTNKIKEPVFSWLFFCVYQILHCAAWLMCDFAQPVLKVMHIFLAEEPVFTAIHCQVQTTVMLKEGDSIIFGYELTRRCMWVARVKELNQVSVFRVLLRIGCNNYIDSNVAIVDRILKLHFLSFLFERVTR